MTDEPIEHETELFAKLGIQKPSPPSPSNPPEPVASTSAVQRPWLPGNPADLGNDAWPMDSESDHLVYKAVLEKAKSVGLEKEWKQEMVQAAVHMTSVLAADGVSTNTVTRAQTKALSSLATYVSSCE